MKRCVLVFAIACSGDQHHTSAPPPPPPVAHATTCADVKARVEQMYRTDAQAKEPKRVDEAVADNTQMVMNDCAKEPSKIVACLANAPSVTELEKQCLIPIDDEGTEARAK